MRASLTGCYSLLVRNKSHTLKTQLSFFVSLKTHQTTQSSLDSISAHCIPISHKKKCSNLFANTTANTIILTHQSPHPLLGSLIVNTSLKPSSGHQNGSRLLGHLNGPFEIPPTRTRLAARACYQKTSRLSSRNNSLKFKPQTLQKKYYRLSPPTTQVYRNSKRSS